MLGGRPPPSILDKRIRPALPLSGKIRLVLPPLDSYVLADAEPLVTPALLIYPEIVDANIKATIKLAGGNPDRWRPHIKTAKVSAVIRQLIAQGVHSLKCSTTLELLTGCEAGASDVLLAYAVMGANAARVRQIAALYPKTRISVLIESPEQAKVWHNSEVGIFIDVNSGMNRTGISEDRVDEIVAMAAPLAAQFRGLHYYDGHMASVPPAEREAHTHAGYDRLLQIVSRLEAAHLHVSEVVTSGTPSAPFAMSYRGFEGAGFIHQISPGTVVYNDMTSLQQLPDLGLQPAALVLTTVISQPKPNTITCDAGHKSVSADAGPPTCAVIGYPHLRPAKPSEEHLPIESVDMHPPAPGEKLYLLPHHVCPTVNNFDQAVMVVAGRVRAIEPVSARGHESPVAALPKAQLQPKPLASYAVRNPG